MIFRRARGRASIELGVPLSPDHAFRIASVTKMFTAASILKLVEAGKLSLDDAVSLYLPDMPAAGSVTIRQLLNHTAGISDVGKDPPPGFARRDVDSATRVAAIGARPLTFPPGTRWSYSNSGYILLGAVIGKVTGEAWHATLQAQFLKRLGMTQTRYGDTSILIPGRAAGYTKDSRTRAVRNADFVSANVPDSAGALVSTVDEHTVRALSVRGRTLYSQRGTGNVIPLQMTASKQLHFDPDELSYFVPVRDAAGRVIRLDYYRDGEGPPQPLPRVEKD